MQIATIVAGTPAFYERHQRLLTKTWKVMRITAILLTAFCLQVSAKTLSQTVTLTGKNLPLAKVFDAVRQQTNYFIIYDAQVLENSKPVTVQAVNEPLTDFLNLVLADQPLTYSLNNTTISIRKKEITTPNPALLPIDGIVKGVDGKPLPNVNVQVKGTNKGTITDNDGRFSLDVDPGDVLVVSSIGFGSKEVRVNSHNRELVIALDISSSPLDEVQVIAYGQTSRRFNTGNTGTVTSTEIARQPVASPLLSLQGRVPGLFINQNSGVPGAGISVNIQGTNSILNGNDPLYVIDGVPYISQMLPSNAGILQLSGINRSTVNGNGNPLNYINPADIERIDILKDADATAIYGSRGANGVILITTKKGKAGKTVIDVQAQSGFGKISRTMDLLNTQQYLALRHEALKNDGVQASDFDFDINGTWDTTRYTDWQKKLVGRTAKYNDIQASVSGGSNNTQFLIGAGYHRETTVFPGDFADTKGSVHFNLNHKDANEKFNIQLSGNYLADNNRLLQVNLMESALRLPPLAPDPHNPDGSLNWAPSTFGSGTWTNPFADLNRKFNSRINNLISGAMISYRLVKQLEFKINAGYTDMNQYEFTALPQTVFDPALWRTQGDLIRKATYVNNKINSWNLEPQLVYNTSISKGKFSLLVGSTMLHLKRSGQFMRGRGYNSDFVLEDINAASQKSTDPSTYSLYKYNALFGRLNYTWDDKYIISLTARRDGSSRFGPENRFNNFGSGAVAWIFTNEKVLRGQKGLSFGKLRISYGTTGSDQIGDYRYLSQYTVSGVGLPYAGITNLEVNGLNNPVLQWESTRKLQFGLDLGFLNDRIYLTGNYFINRSSNQILEFALPSTTGFSAIPTNLPAVVENSGLELLLNSRNIESGNFNWSTSFNLTIPKNKLVRFNRFNEYSGAYDLIVGEPINITKLYHYAGVNTETGVYEFFDKEGKITSTPDFTNDRTEIIDQSPTLFGGLSNTFRFKGLELDVLFQFVKKISKNYYYGNFPGAANFNQPIYLLDRWTPDNTASSHQLLNANYQWAAQYGYVVNSNAGYSDGSYIRLKNISLSWELPKKWSGADFRQIRLFAQAQNLLTITNFKGLDPETGNVALPPLRTVTFGVRLML